MPHLQHIIFTGVRPAHLKRFKTAHDLQYLHIKNRSHVFLDIRPFTHFWRKIWKTTKITLVPPSVGRLVEFLSFSPSLSLWDLWFLTLLWQYNNNN